jgi:Ser/Thr protein kinase RdoA (MazF antagonist)
MSDHQMLARLARLARLALAEYDLEVRRLRMLPLATNAIFRVDTAAGPFALRVAAPGWRELSDLNSEALWLSALSQETSLAVPVPVRSTSGDLVVSVELGGPHHATLMSWLPGRSLGRYLTAVNLFKMGELFALLHTHGHRWSPPDGFSRRRFDRVLSRGEPDVWQAAAEHHDVSPDDVETIMDLHRRVDAAYGMLDSRDLRVIHGDLHHDNIKVHAGVLCPFDFEDTVWGFRIHDIAMAMLDLWDAVDPQTYDRLFDAFHRGYTTALSWPEGDLTLFQLGRYVWRLNWVARHQSGHVADAVRATANAFQYARDTTHLLPRRANRRD